MGAEGRGLGGKSQGGKEKRTTMTRDKKAYLRRWSIGSNRKTD